MSMIHKLGAYSIGGLMLLGASSCNNLNEEAEKSKQDALEVLNYRELKQKDYEKLLEGERNAKGQPILAVTENARIIQYWDSLKLDALCKKAYQEGAQMVRDSIAKANAEKE